MTFESTDVKSSSIFNLAATKCMKNEIFNRIFLEELANVKMCMPDIKHIVHK